MPASLTYIGLEAFKNCSSLMEIELPAALINIDHYAFFGCSSLTEIELPAALSSIVGYPFFGCSSLTGITVDHNNLVYMSQDGILYDKKQENVICCPAGKKGSVIIPESVTSINDGAFSGCSGLTEIKLPKGLTSIESYTF